MMTADPPNEKQRLRRAARMLLEQVTPEQARAVGFSIAEILVQSVFWRATSRVGLFVSRADEVDTSILLRRALEDGKEALLPRITAAGNLEFASLGDPDRLHVGRFGIPEPPPNRPAVRLDDDVLILLPGLAFDRNGGRLGRGGGYYDRALAIDRRAALEPMLIGVGFSFQLVERVPMDALDVRLDGVVSDLGLIETDESRQRRDRTK
jgi:5-formyltetrahydrofolate cyclo-ligase